MCVKFKLAKFLDDIKYLKDDIYDLCYATDGYKGMSRLNALDNRRKNFYLRLTFNMSHEMTIGEAEDSKILLSAPAGEEDIIDCVFVDEITDAVYYEFFAVLKSNLPIKLCKNCNLPFIPKGRIDSLYCDRVTPGAKDKCSAVGAHNAYKNSLSDVESEFYSARRRYNTRVSRNPLLKTEFEVWKIKAKEKLIAYRNGDISADEFKKWFMDDGWMKL